MGEQSGEIDFARVAKVHQVGQALGSDRAQRGDEAAVVEAAVDGNRNGRLAAVDSDRRDRASHAGDREAVRQGLLLAESLDRHIDTQTAGTFQDGLDGGGRIEDFVGAEAARQCRPLGNRLDREDRAGAMELRRRRRAETDRSLGEDGHRVAGPDAAALDGPEAGGHDVAGEEHGAGVGGFRQDGGREIRPGQEEGFSLGAEEQVHRGAVLDADAGVAALAAGAVAAGGQAGGDDAVADAQALDAFTDRFDHADGLVPHGHAGRDFVEIVQHMDVRAADRRQFGTDQGLAGAGVGQFHVDEGDLALSFLHADFCRRHGRESCAGAWLGQAPADWIGPSQAVRSASLPPWNAEGRKVFMSTVRRTAQGPTVSVAQISPVLGDVEANMAKHREAIWNAVEAGVDLLVFPELSLTGYRLKDTVPDVARSRGATELQEFAGLSKTLSMVVGFVEESSDHHFFNSAAYFEGGRLLAVHRKVYLPTYGMFDEQRYFARGRMIRAFQTRFGRMAMLLCEDMLHPTAPVVAGLDGATTLIVPSASPSRGVVGETDDELDANGRHWETYNRTMARSLGCFVVHANRTGVEDGITFWGGSEIVGPSGESLAKAEYFEDGTASAVLADDTLRRRRIKNPALADEDADLVINELCRIRDRRPPAPERRSEERRDDRPPRRDDRPPRRGDGPPRGERDGNRDDRGRGGYGGGREDRGRGGFGGNREDRGRGGYGGNREGRGDRDGNRDDRGRGGYGGPREDRGRGGFGGGREDRGRGGFGGNREDRGRGGFGGGRDDRGRGGYGGARDERGDFDGNRDDRGRGGYGGGRDDRGRGGYGGGREDRGRGGRSERDFGGAREEGGPGEDATGDAPTRKRPARSAERKPRRLSAADVSSAPEGNDED